MSKIRNLQGGVKAFFCPGCQEVHAVNQGGPRWQYNGNPDKPTFSPSILITYKWSEKCESGDDPADYEDEVCHSFVRDGMIQFLGDCTHHLSGQTVPIPEWPHGPGTYGEIEE